MEPHHLVVWPSGDPHYCAPECYDNMCFPESDVFAFGLILYELLTGLTVFPETMAQIQIQAMISAKDERPDIPEYLLPAAVELITACWETDPDDRPDFDEIVNRLYRINFKLMPNVNRLKILAFIKQIEDQAS
jgi:serine/threonine protein kinase